MHDQFLNLAMHMKLKVSMNSLVQGSYNSSLEFFKGGLNVVDIFLNIVYCFTF